MKEFIRLHSATLILVFACLFLIWFSQPVEVVDVHKDREYGDVLVRHFPVTDKAKIDWWYRNELMLREKYKIPSSRADGLFTITFWDFADGYKEDEYDRLCFDDMKAKLNCIEKNHLLTIDNDRHGNTFFNVDSGYYYTNKKGELVKRKHENNASD